MQVIEFKFNPQLKSDSIFDSFCHDPENFYEKKLGSLYLAGILKNILPQNIRFLNNLAEIIKKEYYRSITRKPEKALKEGLKKANEFLEKNAKKGDVSWLGNLSFAALSLKNYELNFTKTGDLKVFLLRGEKIIDIDRKLKFEEIDPWPLKIFGNIVSGKLTEGDILLVLTKEISDFFEKENLLPKIGKIWPVNENEIRKILDGKKEEILKISGISLFIIFTKEKLSGKKQVISPKSYPKEFNLKKVFSPFFVFLKKIKLPNPPEIKITDRLKRIKVKPPEIKLPKFPKINKKIFLVLALVFFLSVSFFIVRIQEKKDLEKNEAILSEIQKKSDKAESFLILKTPQAEKEAIFLLKESWEEICQLTKIISNLPKDFHFRVFSLKENISKNLFELNKLEIIEEPDLFFEFDHREFVPQKMAFFNEGLYFFSPYSENLFKINKISKEEDNPRFSFFGENWTGKVIEIDRKFNSAAEIDGSIVFFTKPNQITFFKNGDFFSFFLEEPHADFEFESFSSFRENLYFLDKFSEEIIRYPYSKNLNWGSPQAWLKKEEKIIDGKYLTVDGSVWVLEKNNSLGLYHAGRLQEKITVEIFPESKDFKKIHTSPALPYLYILEPAQKRIIVFDKTIPVFFPQKGKIIRQIQSQKFDNLLDFGISEDGKIIWILNGLKVYQINL